MNTFFQSATQLLTTAGGRILLALVALIVGRILIRFLVKTVGKVTARSKLDPTVNSFLHSLLQIALYIVLLLAIIEILGIPMTSVLTVLASAGLAIGLALQGALSNCAGGLMLLLFKPISVGDYVSAAGLEGNVKEITVFYTTLLTLDNKRVTIPNGTLMNANIVNYSAEELRRVDLSFKAARGSDVEKVERVMLAAAGESPLALRDPEMFARLNGYTDNGMDFILRVWCKSADYWDLYYDLLERVNAAFAKEGVAAPVTPLDVTVAK